MGTPRYNAGQAKILVFGIALISLRGSSDCRPGDISLDADDLRHDVYSPRCSDSS